MGKRLFPRLAFQNMKKNGRFYVPYLLADILLVAVYFILKNMSMNEELHEIRGGSSLCLILGMGAWIMGLFSIIMLFYTNSFLMKQRRMELGLYQVLGMEKKHIAGILTWESLFSFLIVTAAGLLGGILLNRLMFLILLKAIALPVSYGADIIPSEVGRTAVLFGILFTVTLIFNLISLYKTNTAELLSASRAGEREPKANWLIGIAGVILLSVGYYTALKLGMPLNFFKLIGAVLLVMAATYALFTSFSILILKLLRKSKGYYYRPKHFINVSGMIYRMKQNAAGLASICILSTGILLLLSCAVCMYVGVDKQMDSQYPYDVSIISRDITSEREEQIHQTIAELAEQYGVTLENEAGYRGLSFVVRTETDPGTNRFTVNWYRLISVTEYNRLTGEDVRLGQGEILLYIPENGDPVKTMDIAGRSYQVAENLEEFPEECGDDGYGWFMSAYEELINNWYVVMWDESEMVSLVNSAQAQNAEPYNGVSYYYSFDLKGQQQNKTDFSISVRTEIMGLGGNQVDARYEAEESFYAMNGGILFMGVFLGLIFLMATVLIIYYKQISEGYDDRNRFAIMRKVGLSREEIRRCIRSQICTIFCLPLAMAVIHVAVAFPMVTKLMTVFGLTDTALLVRCLAGTIVIFAAVYVLVYALTARVYYRIVGETA